MKIKIFFTALIFISTSMMLYAQKHSDPTWYTLMKTPKTNYYKVIQAHKDFWKKHKLPLIQELHDMEDEKYIAVFKNLTTAERRDYIDLILMHREFENWKQEEAPWIQPDGTVLSDEEKMAIITKQQQELKAIEQKNGKN